MMQQLERENLWIKEEDTGASLQRDIIRIPKEVIEHAVSRAILLRLESLERQVEILRENKEVCVSDGEAKEIISKTIDSFKEAGFKNIDVIDLYNKTKLPISQINQVMVQLEKEGKVTEYGESQ